MRSPGVNYCTSDNATESARNMIVVWECKYDFNTCRRLCFITCSASTTPLGRTPKPTCLNRFRTISPLNLDQLVRILVAKLDCQILVTDAHLLAHGPDRHNSPVLEPLYLVAVKGLQLSEQLRQDTAYAILHVQPFDDLFCPAPFFLDRNLHNARLDNAEHIAVEPLIVVHKLL